MTDHDASFLFYPHTRARTHREPIGNDASSSVMRHARGGDHRVHCLIPFDRREGLTTAQAAVVAGRTERRVRQWCIEHDLGRRVAGGPWLVSKVALDMFLNSDLKALRAYLAGDRRSEAVVSYYEAAGLRDLPDRWQHILA